jgi:hypothetical protein
MKTVTLYGTYTLVELLQIILRRIAIIEYVELLKEEYEDSE